MQFELFECYSRYTFCSPNKPMSHGFFLKILGLWKLCVTWNYSTYGLVVSSFLVILLVTDKSTATKDIYVWVFQNGTCTKNPSFQMVHVLKNPSTKSKDWYTATSPLTAVFFDFTKMLPSFLIFKIFSRMISPTLSLWPRWSGGSHSRVVDAGSQ